MAQGVNPVGFRQATRQQRAEMQTATLNSFSQTQTIQIQKVGLLGRLWLTISGTITTGSGTPSGSFPAGTVIPEAPYNLIRLLRVYSSQGVDIVRVSGVGLAMLNKVTSNGKFLSVNPANDFNNSNVFNAAYKVLSGAAAASTAYPTAVSLKIPIMTDDWLMWGMLALQNDNVQLYCDITLGSQTDICGAISGVSLTPNFTVALESEFYSIPASGELPNLNFVSTIIEDDFPFSNTGDITYQPVRGEVYTGILCRLESNNAAVPNADINSTRVLYAQNINPYYETYAHHAMMNFDHSGVWLPDGTVWYDWGDGYGVPEIIEPRDFMNTSQQTDFRLIVNATGFTPTNAIMRVVKRQLGIAPA
jgi:hypothetical protein